MMTRRLRWLTAAALVVTTSSPSVMRAQGTPPRTTDQPAAHRMNAMRRDALEKRFKERIDAIVKERLRLTDEQQLKLREVASRTESARLVLHREEVGLRSALREEMRAGDKANEAKLGELLDQLPGLERRKLDLLESEQRELAMFLSSTQRARYFGLQDELRRGMQDVQRRRLGKDAPPDAPSDARDFRRRGPPPT
jgi:Spy/CpxP family protein refolding chaperone